MFERLEIIPQSLKINRETLYRTFTVGPFLISSLTASPTLSMFTPSDSLKSPYINMGTNLEKIHDKVSDHEKRLSVLEAKLDERFNHIVQVMDERFNHIVQVLQDIKNDTQKIDELDKDFRIFKVVVYILFVVLIGMIAITNPQFKEFLNSLAYFFLKPK